MDVHLDDSLRLYEGMGGVLSHSGGVGSGFDFGLLYRKQQSNDLHIFITLTLMFISCPAPEPSVSDVSCTRLHTAHSRFVG